MGNEVGSQICNPSRAARLYGNTPSGALFGKPVTMLFNGRPTFLTPTLEYISSHASNLGTAVNPEESDNAKQLADVIRTMLDDGEEVDVVRCLQDSDERLAGSGLLPAVALVASWLSMLPDPLVDDGALCALLRAPSDQQLQTPARLLFERSPALCALVQCVIATQQSAGAEAANGLVLIWAPVLFRQTAAITMLLQLPSLVAVVNRLVLWKSTAITAGIEK